MQHAPSPTYEPFSDQSTIRRVNREGVLLLGAGRALLMQLAHPKVAQGVWEHSNFRGDRIGRFLRTLRPIYAMAYGSPAQVKAAADAVNGIHHRIEGEAYSALDPDLLLWVLATLIDTALTMHERFAGPLSPRDAESYYEDVLRIGELLGLSRSQAPADLASFHLYMRRTIDELVVSDQARAIVRDLMTFPLPLVPAGFLARRLTAGLLPPRLRRQFGLGWTPAEEALLSLSSTLSRGLLPCLPPLLHHTPGLLMPPPDNTRK